MSWKLAGDFYENCSCDAICPCTWSNLAHKATRDDYCRFALAFEVDDGPPAALGPFLGEFLGIEQGSISIEHDGKNHRVKVGDLVDYSGERVTIESGDQVTLTNIVAHPAGPTLGLAPVSSSRVSAFGIEYSGQDLSGFANRFNWSG